MTIAGLLLSAYRECFRWCSYPEPKSKPSGKVRSLLMRLIVYWFCSFLLFFCLKDENKLLRLCSSFKNQKIRVIGCVTSVQKEYKHRPYLYWIKYLSWKIGSKSGHTQLRAGKLRGTYLHEGILKESCFCLFVCFLWMDREEIGLS